jgi:hypothetical protein
MPNLQPSTPILPQVITPGENHLIAFLVNDAASGANFNWSGYTPVAKITVGTTVITGSCVVNSNTVTATFTAAQTASLAYPAWGALVIYADPTTGSENLGIAVVQVRTEGVAIP